MFEFFTDPVLRAPTWGCIFMCIASSLLGVVLVLQKKSLLSESLSHAAYPGACLGIALFAAFFSSFEEWAFLGVLGGALCSSLLGLKMIHKLEGQKVAPDSALTFVLAVFFGVGIVVASWMQAVMPTWSRQTQMLLFGQAATMQDMHIWIYGVLALTVALLLGLTFRPLQATLFDSAFAKATKIPVRFLDKMIFWLLALSLIVGIRSVGVVLMSGMVIAPAVAARQYSNRLQIIFPLAAFFGAMSALLGNMLSVTADLPTGPSIVLVGTAIALLSLIFAPQRGLSFRLYRMGAFRLRCIEENILKGLWKGKKMTASSWIETWALWRLRRGGWIANGLLTADGHKKATSIVRLHRLWELYLTEELGFDVEKVHRTAEEMEHILTKEMEERLTRLLENPKQDPHQQPIPERGF